MLAFLTLVATLCELPRPSLQAQMNQAEELARGAANALATLPWPASSRYPLVVDCDLNEMRETLFDSSYIAPTGKQSGPKAVATAFGTVRHADFFFVKKGPQGVWYVSLEYFEAQSAEQVRRYVLNLVAGTFAGGIPHDNSTYGFGDVLLSNIDRRGITNRLSFVAFFNNAAVKCNVAIEGVASSDEIESLLNGFDRWAKSRRPE